MVDRLDHDFILIISFFSFSLFSHPSSLSSHPTHPPLSFHPFPPFPSPQCRVLLLSLSTTVQGKYLPPHSTHRVASPHRAWRNSHLANSTLFYSGNISTSTIKTNCKRHTRMHADPWTNILTTTLPSLYIHTTVDSAGGERVSTAVHIPFFIVVSF